jgi:DNA-binding transcriptional ArsR family regulator
MVEYPADLLDRTFGALADPTRRAILARLTKGGTNVTELARPFDISFQAVSKHLGVLERAGLLTRKKDGRVQRVQLDADRLREAAEWIERYRIFWERSFDGLEAYLRSTGEDA